MKLLLLLAATAATLICAPLANADEPPPPPTGDDTTSLGSWGTDTMGGSMGMDGWSSTMAGTTITTSGWPVSRTQISSPMGDYDATTSYSTTQIEHWSTLESPNIAFNNWAEGYMGKAIEQAAEVRIGSQQLVCENFVCKMVN